MLDAELVVLKENLKGREAASRKSHAKVARLPRYIQFDSSGSDTDTSDEGDSDESVITVHNS